MNGQTKCYEIQAGGLVPAWGVKQFPVKKQV